MKISRRFALIGAALLLAACANDSSDEMAAQRSELDAKADAALAQLYAENPAAKALGAQAKGVLIFPEIIKGGLVVGAQSGSGPLRVGGESVAYYNVTSASIGLQAGGQSFSQVLMFLTDDALAKFRNSAGFEAGVDGTIAVMKTGASGTVDTSNLKSDIVAFVFGEKGLMAAANLEGSKYTKKKL